MRLLVSRVRGPQPDRRTEHASRPSQLVPRSDVCATIRPYSQAPSSVPSWRCTCADVEPRSRRTLVLPIVIVLVAVAGVSLVVARDVSHEFHCANPPTPQQRTEQESFVTAHLPDARDFKWTVMDCDDQGQAYLDFSSRRRGTDVSHAFLQDPTCRASAQPDASAGDVTCVSGGVAVSISFEDHGAIDTHGQLSPHLS